MHKPIRNRVYDSRVLQEPGEILNGVGQFCVGCYRGKIAAPSEGHLLKTTDHPLLFASPGV